VNTVSMGAISANVKPIEVTGGKAMESFQECDHVVTKTESAGLLRGNEIPFQKVLGRYILIGLTDGSEFDLSPGESHCRVASVA